MFRRDPFYFVKGFNRLVPIAGIVFCCLGLGTAMTAAGAEGPLEAGQGLARSLQNQSEIQEQVRSWTREKRELVNEILGLKTSLEWHRYQNEKYDAYLERKKESIDELKRRKQEMRTLRMELEPYLEKVIQDLGSFVGNDMSFLVQERKDRLEYLKESMTDYHLSMSEKLRRVLEALQVEAQYGRSSEVKARSLRIDGQTMQAEVLRVGRVARFYRSLDGESLGRWDKRTKSWELLSSDFSRSLKKAMDMTGQKQAVELVDLPIGGLE